MLIKPSCATALVVAFLCGCAAQSPPPTDLDKTPYRAKATTNTALTHDDVIAIDLVNALVQIDQLHPATLPGVRMAVSEDSFGEVLENVLSSAGYTVQRIAAGTTDAYPELEWLTTTTSVDEQAGAVPSQRYTIVVRGVTLSREYQLNPRSVHPSSNLYLEGVEGTQIKLYDELFDQAVLPNHADLSTQHERAVKEGSAVASTKNMFDIGGSNYRDELPNYTSISTLVITFKEDGDALTEQSISRLRRFLLSVNRDTDAVSVIGCSIGGTRHRRGNEGLAMIRTSVVTRWLESAGMDKDRLLDESCWAEKPGGFDLPRRGVMLTVLRERKNG